MMIDAEIDGSALRPQFIGRMREVPGAVAIIATAENGEFRGLVATAWCSLSADPPSMLICVNKSASAHDAIVRVGIFSVNQLANGHDEMVEIFSNRRGLKDHARFIGSEWRVGETGAPLLEKAVTAYDCHVVSRLEHGTHSIFVGNVVGLHVSEGECVPLSYLGGKLCTSMPIVA